MSLEQYKDATRKELWEILQIQVERIAKLEEEQELNALRERVRELLIERKEQCYE